MKKILLMMLLLIPNIVVAATCPAADKAELLSKVGVITVNYEEMTGYYTGEEVGYPEGLPEEDYADYKLEFNYFNVNLLNLTEAFYAVITNNVNDNKIIVNYSDLSDGTYTFKHSTLSSVTTYTVNIYASDDTECEDELINVKYLVVPKYNIFSVYDMCSDYQDEAVCQKYTTVDTYTDTYILDSLKPSISSNDDIVDDDNKSDDSFFENNYINILIGGISIAIIVVIVIIVKQRRSDLK